jgi:dihydrofolate synthase/folylpolyglutamate synthase
MPRRLRVDMPGYYHLLNRGVQQRKIYKDREDFIKFLAIICEASQLFDVDVHSYVLMSNHYHLLIESKKENLSKYMKYINANYAIYFNKKYNQTGYLWQGRYKSWYVTDEAYLYTLIRYIENNPLKAKIVDRLGKYRYSSYNAFVKKDEIPVCLKNSIMLKQFERVEDVEEFFEADTDYELLSEIEKSSRLVVASIKSKKNTLNRLKGIFKEQKDRDKAIYEAYKEEFTQTQIAKFLGLTQASISKIVKRESYSYNPTPLELFLRGKPLYYDEIDYTRMPRIYEAVKSHFYIPKIIHIVGTNAKGSTGRYLAHALHVRGIKTGHYTSPHILKFNERIWIDGADVSDEVLEDEHKRLFGILGKKRADELSYFEYTTLLAMFCFRDCEYVVLEAGLGGEHDATNVFEKVLSLFTPIDTDHQAFLGDDIKSIASTKLRSMQDVALIAPQPHSKVYDIFEEIAKLKDVKTYYVSKLIDKSDIELVSSFSDEIPTYMQENMLSAISALKLLHVSYNRDSFKDATLFGRLTKIAKNIYLDVGHNVLAARVIAEHFKGQKLHLIYNSYADKDYTQILRELKPIIECVEIIEIDSIRAEDTMELKKTLKSENINYQNFLTCKNENRYLVFGSFSVAEAFLKQVN